MRGVSAAADGRPRCRIAPLAERLRGERGLTMVELLMALFAALLVIVIPTAWIVLSISNSNTTASRSLSATQAETGLQALTRDLREASSTTTLTWGATSASATFSIPTPGNSSSLEAVTWSCTFSGGTCTRQVGTGSAIPELKNVVNVTFAPTNTNGNALSSPATDPMYVGITVEVQNASSLDRTSISEVSSKPITLADGAYLRNGA